MEKITKAQYIQSLKSDIFYKLGYYSNGLDSIKQAIIDKNWDFSMVKNNYECFISCEKSTEFCFSVNGETVHEPYKGKFYRFYHNDLCYFLHVYADNNISIKAIKV